MLYLVPPRLASPGLENGTAQAPGLDGSGEVAGGGVRFVGAEAKRSLINSTSHTVRVWA